MRTITVIFLSITILILLAGCSNSRLENSYFENTSSDSYDEAMSILFDKINLARGQLHTYYPRSSQDSVMWFEDTYVNLQIWSKDTIYRHDLINYSLSDDRDYMRYSDLYALDNYYASVYLPDSCSNIKEGELCTSTYDHSNYSLNYPSRSGIRFYMDKDSLLVNSFYTVNQSTLFNFIFYFYKNEDFKDVMEMTMLISNLSHSEYETISHTKLIYGVSETSYRFNNCTLSDIEQGSVSMEYLYTKFKEYSISDLKHNEIDSFVHLYFNNASTYGTIYDGSTHERYAVSARDEIYTASNYYQYIRNAEAIVYAPSYYKVNLSEVLGWDNIRRNDSGLSPTYDLYYGDTLLSGGNTIMLNYADSEYPYYEYSGSNPIESVINLSVIGLSTDFTTAYFEAKLVEGAALMEQTLVDRNLDHDYQDRVEIFRSVIEIPDFDIFTNI